MSRWLSVVLLAFLVQAFPTTQAVSSTTINGSVVDGRLTPVAGVAVTLELGGRVVSRATSDQNGKFTFSAVNPGTYLVHATHAGFPAFSRNVKVSGAATVMQLPIVMSRPEDERADKTQTDYVSGVRGGMPVAAPPAVGLPPAPQRTETLTAAGGRGGSGNGNATAQRAVGGAQYPPIIEQRDLWRPIESGETYAEIRPNQFQLTSERKLSTFGADVDTASYTNTRRFLSSGQLPPADAVRVEEFINYFRFDFAAPRDGKPVAITTEIGNCPWAPTHKLVLIGARAAMPIPGRYEGRNIVLLVDVSGSMQPAERLPLIKTALNMFVDTLTADDTIAIVTYAGTSGVALPPTNGAARRTIHNAIAELGAGGSTNGAQGIIAAYRVAREAFIPGGINRVILATDGDFNVGITSQAALYRLIERERDSGVFLSVLGVGSGNLKDQTMEMLADKGNGNYSYIDSLQEARRVLISEGDATLTTVAKDVKFQVEFNPAVVAEWKLIGYENRKMAARDFENDRKDSGDMGAGHTVTVLYEVIPARNGHIGADSFTVNMRYKEPEGETSQLLVHRAKPSESSQFLPFASAVAEFGLLLRDRPRESERWDSLTRRLASMRAPSGLAEEKSELEEMVTLARAIGRIPRG